MPLNTLTANMFVLMAQFLTKRVSRDRLTNRKRSFCNATATTFMIVNNKRRYLRWSFMYLVFCRMPDERYRRRLRSLLCLCDDFAALVNSPLCQ